MTRAYLGLGSNLGDRRELLRQAIEALDWGGVSVVARSRVYETTPVGGPGGQPDFLNQVIAVETALDAHGLWERCSAVEASLGRSREHETRWGPRAIDIDVLTFGDSVLQDPDLEIPHPRMAERGFVLVPLAEIAPDLRIDGLGTAADLARGLPSDGSVRPTWD
ncbi:MAG TPA: 2-amino-4-hydroxy-6-hydroxymethyldihydropteridine diphosphokinase [Actinomycetota bacterium]|nr:2-amino-4-hydroxy-6-hydroxymethyldihydropteridine diphosphokinase [Actinomycetota bacterium]